MRGHIKFGLLGPLEVWSGDLRLHLGPPQRRVLLARLLIGDGRPVSADHLCEDLWEGHPPAGALSSVHSHISRLRTVLEPGRTRRGQADILVSDPNGYTLNASLDTYDSVRFEQAVDSSRALSASGRLDEARREVERGLCLWRGAALAEAADYAFAAREISRLEEIRLGAGELHASILLQQGEHESAVHIAEELTARSALRETAWALLMRGLYLAGRPADALRRFETIRALLAEELGAVPSPELSSVHAAVLRQDLAALAPFRARATLTPAPPVKAAGATKSAGAVPATQPLVGRSEEMSSFDQLLDEAGRGHARWVLLSGDTGIGKTRLAEEFAHRAAEDAFEVVWVRCGSDVSSEEEDSDDDGSEVAPLASELFPGIEAEGGRDAVAHAVTKGLTDRPTICVIDDLHLAGRRFWRRLGASVPFLRDLPLIVVCTTQDTDDVDLRALLALLVRRADPTLLPLGPLTEADVHELMKHGPARVTPGRLAQDLRRRAAAVHRRGEGNPFLITEILTLPDDQRADPGARLPASVLHVLRARLDLLDGTLLRMLEVTAVTGGELDPELLMRMRAITYEELGRLIDAAVRTQVLIWKDTSAGARGRYVLPELVRDVLVYDLTPVRRQCIHAATARALAERPDGDRAAIARHLMAAGPVAALEELAVASIHPDDRCANDDHVTEGATWFDGVAALTT